MASLQRRFFGLDVPDARLRGSLRFAPVQVISALGVFAFSFSDPHPFQGVHFAIIIVFAISLPLLIASYVLQSRELASRDHSYALAAGDNA
jgi:hypothetical protein